MAPEYNCFQKNRAQYGAIEEWECLTCLKIMPSPASSALNRDTCTCLDAGSFAQDRNDPQQTEAFGQQVYQYQPPRTTVHVQLQSYASSSVSAPCPEGPEREVPNTAVANRHLPVAVDPGLNDPHYRLSNLAPPGLSLQMWRFLVDEDSNRPGFVAEPASPDAGLLAEDFRLRSKKRGSSIKRRKASHQSAFSSSSEEHSFPGCDVDDMAGIGSWDDNGNYVYSGNEYPMTMSGLVEYPTEG